MISIYSFSKLLVALITLTSFVFFMFAKKTKGEGSRIASVSWFALVVSATVLSFILVYGIAYYRDLSLLWVYVACSILTLVVGYTAFYLFKLSDVKKRKIAGVLIVSLCLLVFLSFFHSGYLRYQSIIAKPCPQGQVLNVSEKGKMFKYALIGGPINHIPFIRCITP